MVGCILGTCIGIISLRGFKNGGSNFKLAGDRPIVRCLLSTVVVVSGRVMLVFVLF